MSEPVSRLDLELLALGELDADQAAAIRDRMDTDADLAERFARIERELDAAGPLPDLVLPDLAALQGAPDGGAVAGDGTVPLVSPQSRVTGEEAPGEGASPGAGDARSGFPRWASLGAVAALLAAAVALLVMLPGDPGTGTTFRGSLDLEVYRIRQGVAEPVGMLVHARAGDRLQYRVRAGADGWIGVYDVQDDGLVSVWAEPRPVRAGELFEAAAVLDDYPSLERVYFVYTPVEPARGAFERAVHAAWGPPLAELDAIPGLRDAVQRSISVLEDAP